MAAIVVLFDELQTCLRLCLVLPWKECTKSCLCKQEQLRLDNEYVTQNPVLRQRPSRSTAVNACDARLSSDCCEAASNLVFLYLDVQLLTVPYGALLLAMP